MQTKSLGFIGAGRITRIFLQAFVNRNISIDRISAFDVDKDVVSLLHNQFPGVQITGDPESVANRDIVILAVHPPVMIETLGRIKESLTADSILVSLAPKVNIEKISAVTNSENIVRMIPNATSYINEGYNPVCFSSGFSADKDELMGLLRVLGKTFEVPEDKLEAYAIISAMLPTYFWFQWKTIAALGVRMGMHEDEANEAVYETLIASLNTMFKSGENTDAVMDLIPVKPIGEHEGQIKKIYEEKLWSLYEKIRP